MIKKGIFVARTTQSPIGCIEVQMGWKGLVGVYLFGKKPVFNAVDITPGANDPAGQVLAQIMEYLDGKRREFEVPIEWNNLDPFLVMVLKRTMEIPYGKFMTYDDVAHDLEIPTVKRVVNNILVLNPFPIIVPCHRVIEKHGKLGDYAAADGVRAKQWLLELEGHEFSGRRLV